MTPTILFVHGMFMTGLSWTPWVERFTARGYRCLAPSWPAHEGDVETLRKSPHAGLSRLTLTDVVDAMAKVASALEDPPIVVGHSMGGLVVQQLVQRSLVRRAVTIASAPPKGIRSFAWSHLKSNSAVLWPSSAPIVPTESWFRYAFANVQPQEEARMLFERHCVCESRLVGRGPLGNEAHVEFAKVRVPLHFIAGSDDHIIPASLVRRTYERYQAERAPVSFEVLTGHSHALCIEARWSEVADAVERVVAAQVEAS